MVYEIIYGPLNAIFGPIIAMDPNPNNPIFTIFLISTLVAFFITLANKLLVDQDKLESIKKEMQEFQQEMREVQKSGDSKSMEKMQKQQMEMMGKQKDMMFMSFKPMLVTMVPIFIVFYWMSQEPHILQTIVVLPQIAYYVLLVPFWQYIAGFFYGNSGIAVPTGALGWLGWYILCSFAMSQIFRKFMGLKGGM
ncbi:MAG: DUF106 domain-containing protein [Methanobacteriaceae archaeon]|nr:DUF106 domain-containing protein [Methanobacteriaceae archaeon]MDP2837550.1 DUF106 domain-containing protein [Methanobacteriaceae archaeon]MDP3034161.1 DUF106 domain-containing protein [Methanobacteriaceae archaeon]MDP3484165.1 DUF106 domain-containing protein [Methanobacteriaceae archaeon]